MLPHLPCVGRVERRRVMTDCKFCGKPFHLEKVKFDDANNGIEVTLVCECSVWQGLNCFTCGALLYPKEL